MGNPTYTTRELQPAGGLEEELHWAGLIPKFIPSVPAAHLQQPQAQLISVRIHFTSVRKQPTEEEVGKTSSLQV